MSEDNFKEDITISPCVNCKWKNTSKCYRCINRNNVNKLEYWQPMILPYTITCAF